MIKSKTSRRIIIAFILVTLIQMTLVYERTNMFPVRQVSSFFMSFIIIAWTIKCGARIIHKFMRRAAVMIGVLMFSWYIMIELKYELLISYPDVCRYLWYMYYIPMLLIPVFSYGIAVSLGKSQKDHPMRTCNFLVADTFIIIVAILTNDFHRLAFSFPRGIANFSTVYKHEVFYYISVFWIIGMTIITLAVIYNKCAVKESRKQFWVVLVPIVLGSAAMLIEAVWPELRINRCFRLADSYCLAAMGCIEGLIQTGFITSNQGYRAFFKNSTIYSFVTDKDLNVILVSGGKTKVSESEMERAKEFGSYVTGSKRIICEKIPGGYAFRTEDLSRIIEINNKIEEVNEELLEERNILGEEMRLKKERSAIETTTRLYESIEESVKDELDSLDELVGNDLLSEEEFIENLKKSCMIQAYIKRRANLMLLSEANETVDILELKLSVDELCENLRILDIPAFTFIEGEGQINKLLVLYLFDAIWEVFKDAYDKIEALMVNIAYKTDKNRTFGMEIRISISTTEEIAFSEKQRGLSFILNRTIERDDEGYLIKYYVGGDIDES